MCRMLKSGWRFTLGIVMLMMMVSGCNLRQANAPTNTPFPTPDIPRVRFLFPDNNSNVLEGTDLAVEVLAEQYYKVLTLGQPHILDAHEMTVVLEKFKNYGQKAQQGPK